MEEAHECHKLPIGAELEMVGQGCLSWARSRWHAAQCGTSERWVLGAAVGIKALEHHIGTTEGTCLERTTGNTVSLAVCRSSSEHQKWSTTSQTSGNLEEMDIRVEGSNVSCLAVDDQSQLVVRDCFSERTRWRLHRPK